MNVVLRTIEAILWQVPLIFAKVKLVIDSDGGKTAKYPIEPFNDLSFLCFACNFALVHGSLFVSAQKPLYRWHSRHLFLA